MRRIATPTSARAARTAAAALTALLATLPVACGPDTTTDGIDDAMRAYGQKRYAESATLAQRAQDASRDPEARRRAAYLRGRAAYELERWDEARDAFVLAASSGDPGLAGDALAMQGAVAVSQLRWADAERLYLAAADRLRSVSPDAAAKARRQAEEAHRLVDASQRPTKAAKAAESVGPPTAPPVPPPGSLPNSAVAPPPDNGRWTVVAGTFSNETAARQRATTVAGDAKRAGLGAPRVLAMTSGTRRLWVVEIGTFESKARAEAARKKITVQDAAVALSQAKK